MSDYQRIEIGGVADLHAWLRDNQGQKQSVWLVRFRKQAGARYVCYDAVVDAVLAFGWIDSLPRKLDETRTMLLISPRKPGSAWSRVNKDRVARLEAAGLMAEPGRVAVAAAQADGSWSFLDDVDRLERPEDLAAALGADPAARAAFDGFAPSSQRGILEWIKQARRPETRQRRIEETVRLAAQGIKANHPRQGGDGA